MHADTTEAIHTGRSRGPFPPAAPSDPDAPHVRTARVVVDARLEDGPVARVWESIGFDEINWTYTPTGRRLLHKFGAMSGGRSFHVRPHYMFCSGSGFGIPHWGSGNVYHETPDGEPCYDFTILDQAHDAIVEAGHHVLVELGFTPRDLVPAEAAALSITPSPTVYTSYEAGTWAYPPKDYGKWGALVEAVVAHCRDRYGEDEVATWLWELWNEPDIFYWRGTPDQFNELYSVTARAVRNVLPNGLVGGPTVTSGGLDFLRQFLDYTSGRGEPLDFVSYHTKGSRFPTREYRPLDAPASEQLNPSSTKMLADLRDFNRTIGEYESYRHLPAVVDECDAAVPAHFGVYDNKNYEFQNTEYYPVFQIKLMKKILDLNAAETVQVSQATSWSFYFEGERFFEGTRSFQTAGEVEKPFLNGYRMLCRLGDVRLRAVSDAAWEIAELDAATGASMREEVDALATRDDAGAIAVLVWRHTDDQYRTDDATAVVRLDVDGLAAPAYRLTHHRIDARHSNAHTVWRAAGSPQNPGDDELAAIRSRQGLEEAEPEREVVPDAGRVGVHLELPLPSASLLVLTPAESAR